ncbi:MAG: sulfite exporter TauE/SafE family protein [Micavibrio sp.]|nr:sulfite exporter TauE/SafE family protein [Micavibrio sp.]
MIDQAILFVASFLANTMSAFAGGGSGLVQLPVIILLGLPFSEALATHKMANFMLGAGSIARNIKNRDASWRFIIFMAVTGVIGTIIGARLIIDVPDRSAQVTLGIFTIALGAYSFFRKKTGEDHAPKNRNIKGHIIGGAGLFALGVFSGSLTSGSGLFVTMWLIAWYGFDYKIAVFYTMAIVGFLWNLTGGLSLLALGGDVQWGWLPVLWVATFLGGWMGAHLGHLKGNLWIKRAFTCVALISGILLLLK